MRALVPSPIFLRIDKRGEMSAVILRGVVAFAAILCNSLSDLPIIILKVRVFVHKLMHG